MGRDIRNFTHTAARPVAAALALTILAVPAAAATARSETVAAAYPAYHGPKKTLAISGFEASGTAAAALGGWDIGGQLAAMLATELSRTNRFIVVERGDLDTLTRERQLIEAGLASGPSGGSLLGAQLFIRGTVTEFEEQESAGGLKLGFGSGNLLGALTGGRSKGHIAIDLRVIDAATGVIVASFATRKQIRSSSIGFEGSKGGLSFGAEQFAKTPLGATAREAKGEGVRALVAGMERVPWRALVSEVDGERVYINAGRSANLAPGATMRAVRRARTITDPATGEVLGSEQRTIGDFVIELVEDRYAVGRTTGAGTLRRGDIVYLVEG